MDDWNTESSSDSTSICTWMFSIPSWKILRLHWPSKIISPISSNRPFFRSLPYEPSSISHLTQTLRTSSSLSCLMQARTCIDQNSQSDRCETDESNANKTGQRSLGVVKLVVDLHALNPLIDQVAYACVSIRQKAAAPIDRNHMVWMNWRYVWWWAS